MGTTTIILIILFALIVKILKSPKIKGKIGEFIVNKTNHLRLDKNIYKILENITLKLKDGTTTQIDHVIISKYGIFVIETKNYKGWIYGNENHKTWTQTIYRKKYKFQNPIHQNYRHIKSLQETLEEFMRIDINKFKSIIVFIGDCEIKTKLPKNIIKGINYINYIKSFNKEILTNLETRTIVNIIGSTRIEENWKTDRKHVQNLKKSTTTQ